MAKNILIKPIISEKSEDLSDALDKFSFVVNKKANKLEIRNAVEEMYNVSVAAVNTINMPGKTKTRNTRSGIIRGKVGAYKKAIITLEEGETIDFFGDI